MSRRFAATCFIVKKGLIQPPSLYSRRLESAHELHLIALVGSPLAASKHPSVVVDVPLVGVLNSLLIYAPSPSTTTSSATGAGTIAQASEANWR